MYRYRLWLKRELQLHSQGISLVNLGRWCWTCHGAMWLKLLCLRLYRELNRRMEGVKSWDVVSCRAAKLHQDPTSGYQWLDHEKQEHKGVCQMNPQVVKYKNEIQWNTSQYIWFALETAAACLALRFYSWPPKVISVADRTTLNGGDSKKSPPKHQKAGISQISQTSMIH